MHSSRRIYVVTTAVGILSLCVFVGTLVVLWVRAVAGRASGALSHELTRRLGRQVHVGRVAVAWSGTIVIRDVRVVDRVNPSYSLFRAESVAVRLAPWRAVLADGYSMSSLDRIKVYKPILFLSRDKSGRWNVEDLLKAQAQAPPSRFRGLVTATDAVVVLRDETGRLTGGRPLLTLTGLSCSADMRREHLARYRASGVLRQPRAARFSLSVEEHSRDNEARIALTAEQLDAQLLTQVAKTAGVSAISGAVDAQVGLVVRRRKVVPESLRGQVKVYGVRVRAAGVPVEAFPLEGTISMSHSQARVQAEANPVGCLVRLYGTVALLGQPRADLVVAVPHVTPRAADRLIGALNRDTDLRLPRGASAEARITGPLSRPVLDLRGQAPEVGVSEVRVQDVQVRSRLEGSRLFVQELSAGVAGGALRCSGWVSLPPTAYAGSRRTASSPLSLSLSGTFADVSIARLHPALASNTAGRASGHFAVQSKGAFRDFRVSVDVPDGRVSWVRFAVAHADLHSADGRIWTARVSAGQMRALRSALEHVSGQLQLSRRGIRVQAASAEGWNGRVFASGTLGRDGRLAWKLSARDVSAESFLSSIGVPGHYSGTVAFHGDLLGTTARPSLSGQIRAIGGMWRDVLFDLVAGRVLASPGHIDFRDIQARRDGSIANVNASVRFAPKGPALVRMTASTDGMPLPLAARFLGLQAGPSGVLAGHVDAEGPADDIKIRGEVTASGLSLPTRPASVVAQFEHSKAGTLIGEVHLTGEGMAFSGDGTITPEGPDGRAPSLNVRLTSDTLDLSVLGKTLWPAAGLNGTAEAEVLVTGSVTSPEVRARVFSSRLSAIGVGTKWADADVHWSAGRLTIGNADVRLADGGQVFAHAEYMPADKWLSAKLSARDMSAATLMQAVEEASRGDRGPWDDVLLEPAGLRLDGRVSADLAATGPIDGLVASGTVAVSNPVLAVQPFHELAFDVSWDPGKVHISDCALSGPGLLLTADVVLPRRAQPTVVLSIPDASVDAVVRTAYNICQHLPRTMASALENFLENLPHPATGTVSVGASLAGIGGSVSGTASFAGHPLVLRSERLDHVEGSFVLRDNKVLVRRLTGEGDQLKATVVGSAGFGGEMDLDIEASNVNLAALAPLLGISGRVSGLADISAKAAGTVERPVLRASASTSSLTVGDFRTRLVSAPGLVVEGNTLTLGDVAVAGDTFQATLSGTLPFSWSPLGVPEDKPIDLSVSLGRQDLSTLSEMTPEVTQAQGYVAGRLRVSGTLKRPLVQGSAEAEAEVLSFARARNSLRSLRAVAEFDERTARITSLQARSDLGGEITGSGWMSLSGMPHSDFHVELAAKDLQLWLANASGKYGEVFRGSVNGTVVLSRQAGQTPHLEGELTTNNGSLTLPTQMPKAVPERAVSLPEVALGSADGDRPFLIRIGRGFQLVRGGLRASLTDDLRLSGLITRPDVSGTLTFENGTVRFATQRFRIVPGGTVTVAYSPTRGARATLDVSAQTTVYARVGPNGQRERYTIIVDLSGPIDNPRATFSSDPPGLSRRQILAVVGRQAELEAILRGQDSDRILREQLGQAFVGALVPEITSPIEHAVAEALGLEEFSIMYDLGAETQVQLTKQLIGRLFLTYRRSVAGSRQDFLWKLAYRIQRRLQLSFSLDERHVRTFAVEGRIHF
ncbi:MAG: translocation/assembly module TamB domain-containing protein [Armatimonadota bacterium]